MRKVALMIGLIAGLGGVALAFGPFKDVPAGPRALPGDLLPPFGMKDDAGHLPSPPPFPPGVTLPGPFGPPESTAAGPVLADAMRYARAAIRACGAKGYRVGVTVVDSAGEARAMLSADEADGSHVFVAMRKTGVAIAFAQPSSQVAEAIAKDPALMAKVTPAMFVEGGAVPIRRGGRIIGAIGVSGAAGVPIGHQDEVCARAGLAG